MNAGTGSLQTAGVTRIDNGGNATLGTISSGLINGQTISTAADFTGTLRVQGAGGLTVGVAGTTDGVINFANSGSSRQVVLQGLSPTGIGNATIQLPSIAGGRPIRSVWLPGNCAGSGGGIVGGGTPGSIPKFTNGNTIGDSGLSESGSTLTYAGNIVANTTAGFTGNLVNLEVNGSSKLTVDQAGNSIQAGTAFVNGNPGTSSVAGSLSVGTGLSVTSGGATIGGTVTLSSLATAGA